MIKKLILLMVTVSVVALLFSVPAFAQLAGKKVLFIDSYHEGYEWSDGVTAGVVDTLANTGVILEIFRMDTKRNGSEEFKKESALKAKTLIEEFKPDVVIACDDNAAKYIIVPYYKNAALPFVFCGLNWDASGYGMPFSNTTGMVEVSLTMEIIQRLKEVGAGERLGYLSADTETEKKNVEYYNKIFNLNFDKIYLAKTQAEWETAFKKLQDEVDLVIIENNAGISDWNEASAKAFVMANVRIPGGTTNPWMMPVSLLGITKIAEEQGAWAANAALKILGGTPAASIPITQNKEGKLYINMSIANKLGVMFKTSLLKHAEIVE